MLKTGLPGGRWASVRELRGRDEASVQSLDSAAAVALVDALLVAQPGTTVAPGRAAELTIGDRDRLLCAIYRATFGDAIETQSPCAACGKRFELQFALTEIEAASSGDGELAITGPDEHGRYTLDESLEFRLPQFADEQAVIGLAPDEAARALVRRCVCGEHEALDHERVSDAMEQVGALVELDMRAACAECGHEQLVHFSIQAFLLAALMREGQWMTREIHRLAMFYRWSLSEILGLTRRQRRLYVQLIERELGARRSA